MAIQSIAIIGTGNVAWHLGAAFRNAGIRIVHIAGRTPEHVQDLAVHLGCNSVSDISESLPYADLYLIAVKDDAIHETAKTIYSPGRLLVHTSGAVPILDIQYGSDAAGAIWPMQTITRSNEINFSNTLFSITGTDSDTNTLLTELADKISSRVIVVSDEQRATMHMAAVWINNYTNHMFDIAFELLLKRGLSLELFFPMIEEHVHKLKSMPPGQLQTGPARRGDMATLQKHYKMLEGNPEWQRLYETIAQSILHKFLSQ